jgi:hypothetical protein
MITCAFAIVRAVGTRQEASVAAEKTGFHTVLAEESTIKITQNGCIRRFLHGENLATVYPVPHG